MAYYEIYSFRGAVLGRGWPTMRLKARAARKNFKLQFAWCSRGSFGKRVAYYEIYSLRGAVLGREAEAIAEQIQ